MRGEKRPTWARFSPRLATHASDGTGGNERLASSRRAGHVGSLQVASTFTVVSGLTSRPKTYRDKS